MLTARHIDPIRLPSRSPYCAARVVIMCRPELLCREPRQHDLLQGRTVADSSCQRRHSCSMPSFTAAWPHTHTRCIHPVGKLQLVPW
jgi:hypothetical protein